MIDYISIFKDDPTLIDSLHKWIDDQLSKHDVVCEVKKYVDGTIKHIKFDIISNDNKPLILTVPVINVNWIRISSDGLWCHPLYCKIKKEDIDNFIITPYIRNNKLNEILNHTGYKELY